MPGPCTCANPFPAKVAVNRDPALVDEILAKIGAKGDEIVKGPAGEKALREVLFHDCRITQTTQNAESRR